MLWYYCPVGVLGVPVLRPVAPASWVQMTRTGSSRIGPAVPVVVVGWKGELNMELLSKTSASSPSRAGGPVLLEGSIRLPDVAGRRRRRRFVSPAIRRGDVVHTYLRVIWAS